MSTNEREVVWRKKPYHKDADRMYGFTDFLINANYMSKKLDRVVAPTDTRRRPD